METEKCPSQFAPPERATKDVLERQRTLLLDVALLQQLYDSVTEIVVVLNSERQIVFHNKNLTKLPGLDGRASLYGLRPGEALDCAHASQSPCGCGTTEFCAACGAVNAILASQTGGEDIRECRILQGTRGNALDLLVRASPLELQAERFTIFAVTDIRDRKRKRALERIFFHDILNSAACLRLAMSILQDHGDAQLDRVCGMLNEGIDMLLEETNCMRDLTAAESGELQVRLSLIASLSLLEELSESYNAYASEKRCHFLIDSNSEEVPLLSNRTLLSRILGNMIKNAVEASEPGDPTTIGCEKVGDEVRFRVHNPGFIPREAQLQIFKRSFSTKGFGRGLGTYSMKLLSERNLHGKVSFRTSVSKGTTFTASVPVQFLRK